MRHAFTVLATLALASLSTLSTGGCCGGSVDNPDDVLRVDVAPDTAGPDGGTPSTTRLCGATVVARDLDGNKTSLAEEADPEGCTYKATVDPRASYVIMVSHPDYADAEGSAESNPGCGVATDPASTDATVFLRKGGALPDGGTAAATR